MNFFNLICHRIPERTFQYKGHYFPVCSRCTGFYLSAFTYCILGYFIPFIYNSSTLILSLLLLIPAGIDGTTQFMELRESNNSLRFVTGILGGLGLVIFFKTLKYLFI